MQFFEPQTPRDTIFVFFAAFFDQYLLQIADPMAFLFGLRGTSSFFIWRVSECTEYNSSALGTMEIGKAAP